MKKSSLHTRVWLKWGSLLVACLVFTLARTWYQADVVFPEHDQTVRLLGNDSYFQLRHAEYSAEHFPELQRVDPGAHFPRRQKQNVSGLFNLSIAAGSFLIEPFSGERSAVAVSAALMPLLLGLGSLICLFLLGWRLGGPWLALPATLFHLLYPSTSLDRTTLGFADQHAAETFLVLAGLTGMVWLSERARENLSLSRGSDWMKAAGCAMPFAMLFFTWLGAPMYIAVYAVATLMLLMVAVSRRDMDGLATALPMFYVATAAWLVSGYILKPDLIMEVAKGIRWWNVGGMLFLGLGSFLYVGLVRKLLTRGWHPVVIILGTLAAVGLTAFVFFNLPGRGQFFWNRISAERSGAIEEQGRVSPAEFIRLFGWAGLLSIIAIPVSWMLKDGNARARTLVVVAGTVTTAIWLRTHDFDYVPPVFVAFMVGVVILGIVNILSRVKGDQEQVRLGRIIGMVVLAAFMLIPARSSRKFYIDEMKARDGAVFQDAWQSAMDWMRENTEVPPVLPMSRVAADEVYPDGSYGVMTAWDFGNFVAQAGERPAVVSRYPSRRDANWSTALTEEDAATFLCPECAPGESVRYAVVNATMASDFFSNRSRARTDSAGVVIFGHWDAGGVRVPNARYGAPYDSALVTRLYRDAGSGLKHYRLVYSSSEQSLSFYRFQPGQDIISRGSQRVGENLSLDLARQIASNPITRLGDAFVYDAWLRPSIQIFEIVPGAVLTGTGVPEDTITVTLALRNLDTRDLKAYRQKAVVDSSRRFSLTVPYHTESSDTSSRWVATGPFLLNYAGKETFPVPISRSAVINGDTLVVN